MKKRVRTKTMTWTWSYGRMQDGQDIIPDKPALRLGQSGIIIVLNERNQFSVTHDASGKCIGLRTHKLTKAKRFARAVAPLTDWHLPDEKSILSKTPDIGPKLRALWDDLG